MLSNDPAEKPQQSSSPSGDKASTAGVSVIDPGKPIEVGSPGSGTINDPGASDTQPPPGVTGDLDYLLG